MCPYAAGARLGSAPTGSPLGSPRISTPLGVPHLALHSRLCTLLLDPGGISVRPLVSPRHPGLRDHSLGGLDPCSGSSALVAPAADDAGVLEGVFAASCVGQDVVDFGAVGASAVLVVESGAAGWAAGDAGFDGLGEGLGTHSFPSCGAGAAGRHRLPLFRRRMSILAATISP